MVSRLVSPGRSVGTLSRGIRGDFRSEWLERAIRRDIRSGEVVIRAAGSSSRAGGRSNFHSIAILYVARSGYDVMYFPASSRFYPTSLCCTSSIIHSVTSISSITFWHPYAEHLTVPQTAFAARIIYHTHPLTETNIPTPIPQTLPPPHTHHTRKTKTISV